MQKRIRCNNIDYRKGYIEVMTGCHDECINLEVWSVQPGFSIEEMDIRDYEFPDGVVQANTELELSIQEAETLISLLKEAIGKLRDAQGAH